MAKDTEVKDPSASSPDDVRNYLRTRKGQFDAKKKLGEAHGQTRSEFVDGTGFNKTAIGFVERLDRMSPEVRADVFRSIDLIRQHMGPVWGQQETGELFPEKTPEEKQDEAKESIARSRTSARRGKAVKPGEKVRLPEPTSPPPMPYYVDPKTNAEVQKEADKALDETDWPEINDGGDDFLGVVPDEAA